MDRDLSSPVACHAGYSGADYPHAVELDGTPLEVKCIIREWRQPGSKTWQVITTQGSELLLSYDEGDHRWAVTEVVHEHLKIS